MADTYSNPNPLNSYLYLHPELKKLFELQDNLACCLNKLEAISTLTLNENFLEYDHATIFDSLWVLNDLILQAKQYQHQFEKHYLSLFPYLLTHLHELI